MRRDAHILQTQTLERLEAKDIANDAGGQVRNGAFLEQVKIIGDVRYILIRTRNRNEPVGFSLVFFVRGEPIGLDRRPGGGGRLTSDRRRRFNWIYPVPF